MTRWVKITELVTGTVLVNVNSAYREDLCGLKRSLLVIMPSR